MGWWKLSSSTSSTSSSSSVAPPSSPSRTGRRDLRDIWSSSSRKDVNQPRLSRQRKLRHPTEVQVRNLAGNAGKEGLAAYSIPVSRSPSNLDDAPMRSMSSPMPLPLPETVLPSSSSGEVCYGRCKLPSPREGSATVEVSTLLAKRVRERLPAVSVAGRFPNATTSRSPEHFDVPAVASNGGQNKNMFRFSNTIKEDFWLNIPTRSAPTSGLCSPVLSPGRPSNGDYFPSGYLTPQSHQPWYVPELSSLEKFFASPERSPLHSPTSKSPGFRSMNPSAPSSPLHSNLFPENSAAWHETHGSVNVHPLPLPRGSPALLPPPPPPTPPSATKSDVPLMGNQWQKGKLIGSGTFGSVYIGTNRHTGALCAMKEVNLIPDDPKSAECIKQLEQEIRFLSQLEHPNIVRYYGSEIIEDRFYIYLEYVYPGSINKYIHDHCGAVTESVVRNFSRHILNGLAYLHSKNAIHRDIKGANLLVNSNGSVKLADFGMAKHLSETKIAYSMMGTPYWMAPEVLQASMNKEIGYNSAIDIWSLGCTIIEMFTGKHPWDGLPSAAAMFKVLHESPHIPETLSPDGKDFLRRCFRRNPAERPSALELLDHPFITDPHHYDLHGSIQSFADLKISDDLHGPNNFTFKSDSPKKGKHAQNSVGYFSSSSESSQTHHDGADPAAFRRSPRSSLETNAKFSHPRASPGASCLPSPSTNGVSGVRWGGGKPQHYACTNSYEKEVLRVS